MQWIAGKSAGWLSFPLISGWVNGIVELRVMQKNSNYCEIMNKNKCHYRSPPIMELQLSEIPLMKWNYVHIYNATMLLFVISTIKYTKPAMLLVQVIYHMFVYHNKQFDVIMANLAYGLTIGPNRKNPPRIR